MEFIVKGEGTSANCLINFFMKRVEKEYSCDADIAKECKKRNDEIYREVKVCIMYVPRSEHNKYIPTYTPLHKLSISNWVSTRNVPDMRIRTAASNLCYIT